MGLILLAEFSVGMAHSNSGRGNGWAWDRDGKQRIFVVFLQPGLVADGSEYCGGLLNSILIQSFFECQHPFKFLCA